MSLEDGGPAVRAGGPGLAARRILVTGATGGGIGSALALRFAAEQASVLVNGRTAEAVSTFLARAAPARGLEPAPFDVRDPDAVASAFASCDPLIDTVVCNAATDHSAAATSHYGSTQWADEIDTILTGAFYVCRAAIPGMVHLGFGRIVLVSSSAALRGTRGRGVGYAAAKAGLLGMTRQLALELGPSGITVNAVAPSQIDTPRIRRGGRKTDGSLHAHGLAAPVGRVGDVRDVVGLVRYLIDGGSGYLTGQVIGLDGGTSLATGSLVEEDVRA